MVSQIPVVMIGAISSAGPGMRGEVLEGVDLQQALMANWAANGGRS